MLRCRVCSIWCRVLCWTVLSMRWRQQIVCQSTYYITLNATRTWYRQVLNWLCEKNQVQCGSQFGLVPVITWFIASVLCANTLLRLEQRLMFVCRGVYSNIFAFSFTKVYGMKPQSYTAVKLINNGCICLKTSSLKYWHDRFEASASDTVKVNHFDWRDAVWQDNLKAFLSGPTEEINFWNLLTRGLELSMQVEQCKNLRTTMFDPKYEIIILLWVLTPAPPRPQHWGYM